MYVEHKNIDLLYRKEFLLMIIGVVMLAVAVVGGFGFGPNGFQIESILGKWITVDPAVTSRGSFVFERWLLVAVLVTATFTVLYWLLFAYFLSKRFDEAVLISDNRIGMEKLILQLFGPAAIIVVVIVLLLTWQYLSDAANAESLKLATFVLLASYVVYDIGFIILGRVRSHSLVAVEMASEGREALYRLDVPMLLGFTVLYFFTKHASQLEMIEQHKLLIYTFGAGAAAFKLILTVTIFTLINYEKLCPIRDDQSKSSNNLSKKGKTRRH